MRMHPTETYIGGIEAGGTKFVCAIANGGNDLIHRTSIPTTTPQETLRQVFSFFRESAVPLSSLGVGAFGPVSIHERERNYGCILATPKQGWSGFDLVGTLKKGLSKPVAIDTDVNCALIAEARYGAGQGLKNLAYATIGTGIGAGIMNEGKVLYGAAHPEIGHMLCPPLDEDMDFAGVCPYHGNKCLEGLTSGPAFKKRWGLKVSDLPEDHHGWDLIAHYVSILCMNLILCAAPDRIILGGGVMENSKLFPMVNAALARNLNGYVFRGFEEGSLSGLIVAPRLEGNAGVLGAIEIARAGRCRRI